jgi:hypothetical protein
MREKFPKVADGNRRNIGELERVSSGTEGGLMSKQNLRSQKRLGAWGVGGGFARIALTVAFWSLLGAVALLSASLARAGTIPEEQDKDGAGITFSKQATPRQVGLPAYPGAKPRKDEKDDSASVQMGLWGGSFGFKLAVMKMESNDAPEKIAEFYRKEKQHVVAIQPNGHGSLFQMVYLEARGDDKDKKPI